MGKKKGLALVCLVLLVFAGLTVILYTDIVQASPSAGRTYSTNEDFEEGSMVGVEAVDDQLQLTERVTTLPFIWVPNNSGTVSKVDTETGDELGRYKVVPPDLPHHGNPSRTTVDLQGNVWVGNRTAGTVVKIGLYEAGQYIDRNEDGIIQTSRDLNEDGDITGDEILPWGEDECVLFEVVLVPGHEGTYAPGEYEGPYDTDFWGTAPRSLAVDAHNNLWVGTGSSQKFYYIDGESGEILNVIDVSLWGHEAYGATIDKNGVIWSLNPLLRIDPAALGENSNSSTSGTSGEALETSSSTFISKPTLLTSDSDSGSIQSNENDHTNYVHAGFITNYDNSVFGNQYDNEMVEHNLHVNTHIHNDHDESGEAVLSPTLNLSCIYTLQNVDSPGAKVSPPEGVDVRWEFDDLAEGEGVHAHGATDQWLMMQTGFSVSREVDQLEFTEPGTQVVTLKVTPEEEMERMQVHLNPEHEGVDAAVTDVQGEATNIYGGLFDAWIENPDVGRTYEWEITVEIYSLPDGYDTLEYMPSIFVSNLIAAIESDYVDSGLNGQSTDLEDNAVATWEWQTEGEYHWHWTQVVEKSVYMAGYASDGNIDVYTNYNSNYSYYTPADEMDNIEIEMHLGVGTHLHNMNDGKWGAVHNPILDLSSDYYIDHTDSTGTEVVPPEGIDYRWEFADVEMGEGQDAHAGIQHNIAMEPGFSVSREVDRREFEEPGTQVLTLTVTPEEQMEWLQIHLNPRVRELDAAVTGATGEGAEIHNGHFDVWIEDPVVGHAYVWEINIEIMELPEIFNMLSYMPDISVHNIISRQEGMAEGSSIEMTSPDLVEGEEFATWHWQAEGAYRWHWEKELGKGIHLGGYINDPEGAIRHVLVPHGLYALSPDYLGNLFITGWMDNKLSKIDIETDEIIFTVDTKEGSARGVAVTAEDNHAWVADTARNSVLRYDNDGNELAEITGMEGPTGVSVDAAGKVWATDLDSEYIHRIDPETNEIDLSKKIIDSWGHYSYSDMTGMVARTITTKTGAWAVVHDSGAEGTPWGTVFWNSEEPEGTSIVIKARSSTDGLTWSGWETAENGELLTALPDGRYIQIEATLQIAEGDQSPILYDLTVHPDYEPVFGVMWLPPMTNEEFALQDGTTLPIKFRLLDENGEAVEEMQEGIYLVLEGVETWVLGEGRDDLRFDTDDYHYIANFHTRQYELDDGLYTVTVYDGNDNALGAYTFELSSQRGTSRGRGGR